jgi:hypothetical protein
MSLRLRAGLSWCICGNRAVFLDLARDRYFMLPERSDPAYRAWAAGEAAEPSALDRLVSAGILVTGKDENEDPGRRPATCLPARRDLASVASGRMPPGDVITAGFGQLHARLSLRRTPVAILLARIAAGCTGRLVPDPDDSGLRRIATAFEALTKIFRAEDECLPRAIAARRMCDRRNLAATLVLGVRLDPFSAHSWVQAGDAVIVGDLEQVRLFTPILVLP